MREAESAQAERHSAARHVVQRTLVGIGAALLLALSLGRGTLTAEVNFAF